MAPLKGRPTRTTYHLTSTHSTTASVPLADGELDAADAQAVAALQPRLGDALVVDERSVRAPEIDDLEVVGGRDQPAVQAGHERGVEDEIGSRCSAHGLDRAGSQPKRPLRALEYPQGGILVRRVELR